MMLGTCQLCLNKKLCWEEKKTSADDSVLDHRRTVEITHRSISCCVDKQNTGYVCVQAHTMECYSALKRKEIVTQARTRTDLEDTLLSEVSQTEKDGYMRSAEEPDPQDRKQSGGCGGWRGGRAVRVDGLRSLGRW